MGSRKPVFNRGFQGHQGKAPTRLSSRALISPRTQGITGNGLLGYTKHVGDKAGNGLHWSWGKGGFASLAGERRFGKEMGERGAGRTRSGA